MSTPVEATEVIEQLLALIKQLSLAVAMAEARVAKLEAQHDETD